MMKIKGDLDNRIHNQITKIMKALQKAQLDWILLPEEEQVAITLVGEREKWVIERYNESLKKDDGENK